MDEVVEFDGATGGSSTIGSIDLNASTDRRVGLIYDDRMCGHYNCDDPYHPECPQRISAIWEKLASSGLTKRCVVLEAEDVEDSHLGLVHTKDHINLIKKISSKKPQARERMSMKFNSIYFNEGSSESASIAAGSVVKVLEQVAQGKLDSAFAVVRPPGHHAEEGEPMGFCLYNNVAVATSYLLSNRSELGMNKILIVDWDVHHSNGTQKAFYDDPRVLFFSVHRHDFGVFYPGGDDGSYEMIGNGPGVGYNINVPWEGPGRGDADYLAVWDHILIPVAEKFNPDIIIVSAGFDAAMGDPLGECCLTPFGYSILLQKLMKFAEGKIVLALEGGYNLDSISNSAQACVEVLLQGESLVEPSKNRPLESTWRVINTVRKALCQYWPVLGVKLDEKAMDGSYEVIDIIDDVIKPLGSLKLVEAAKEGTMVRPSTLRAAAKSTQPSTKAGSSGSASRPSSSAAPERATSSVPGREASSKGGRVVPPVTGRSITTGQGSSSGAGRASATGHSSSSALVRSSTGLRQADAPPAAVVSSRHEARAESGEEAEVPLSRKRPRSAPTGGASLFDLPVAAPNTEVSRIVKKMAAEVESVAQQYNKEARYEGSPSFSAVVSGDPGAWVQWLGRPALERAARSEADLGRSFAQDLCAINLAYRNVFDLTAGTLVRGALREEALKKAIRKHEEKASEGQASLLALQGELVEERRKSREMAGDMETGQDLIRRLKEENASLLGKQEQARREREVAQKDRELLIKAAVDQENVFSALLAKKKQEHAAELAEREKEVAIAFYTSAIGDECSSMLLGSQLGRYLESQRGQVCRTFGVGPEDPRWAEIDPFSKDGNGDPVVEPPEAPLESDRFFPWRDEILAHVEQYMREQAACGRAESPAPTARVEVILPDSPMEVAPPESRPVEAPAAIAMEIAPVLPEEPRPELMDCSPVPPQSEEDRPPLAPTEEDRPPPPPEEDQPPPQEEDQPPPPQEEDRPPPPCT